MHKLKSTEKKQSNYLFTRIVFFHKKFFYVSSSNQVVIMQAREGYSGHFLSVCQQEILKVAAVRT